MSDETKTVVPVPVIVENDRQIIELENGTTLELIPPHTPELKAKIENGYKRGKLMVWDKGYNEGMHSDTFKIVDVDEIEVEVLKKFNIWDCLSDEIKHRVEFHDAQDKQEVIDRMAKARRGRRQKYENVPKELTCTQCKCTVELAPSKIAKTVEKLGILLVDYVANFKCKRCNPPVRGKKPNPEFAALPKELVCKCGAKIKLNPYQLKAKSEKLGTTIQKLIEDYACQTCRPTKLGGKKKSTKVKAISDKPKGKRGRQPNPEFAGLGKTMKCSCGKEAVLNPTYLKAKAEKLGTTMEELIKNFKCQSCAPSRGRPRKVVA